MRGAVQSLIKAQSKLMKAFGCPNEYLVKPMVDCPWHITGTGDMPVLSYVHKEQKHNAVIVRQNGRPMVYRSGGFALVVAIDCVKIAFFFEIKREVTQWDG
jgi:hypothetical protein